ncbi:hypothetical protein ACHAXS_012037 [Conticribra weissflogii]
MNVTYIILSVFRFSMRKTCAADHLNIIRVRGLKKMRCAPSERLRELDAPMLTRASQNILSSSFSSSMILPISLLKASSMEYKIDAALEVELAAEMQVTNREIQ